LNYFHAWVAGTNKGANKIILQKDCDSFLGQNKIKYTKRINVSTLTLHLSNNYHKVALN
jgi:hypothetical protein